MKPCARLLVGDPDPLMFDQLNVPNAFFISARTVAGDFVVARRRFISTISVIRGVTAGWFHCLMKPCSHQRM
jgi:hypothetical protein